METAVTAAEWSKPGLTMEQSWQATFWYGQNRLSGALLPLRPRRECHANRKIEWLQNCRFSGRFWAVFSPVLRGKIVATSFPAKNSARNERRFSPKVR